MVFNAAARAERHLPLDGGGWEGVREPQFRWRTPPTLTLPAKGEGVDCTSGDMVEVPHD
jgi:hypothetical protein